MEVRCVFCEVLIDYLRVKLQRLKHNGTATSHPQRLDANETSLNREMTIHDGERTYSGPHKLTH